MNTSSRSRESINKRRASKNPENDSRWSSFARSVTGALQNARARLPGAYNVHEKVSSVIPIIKSTGRKLWKNVPDKSLINEILILQLFFAFVVGGLAIVGLWLTSTWAIENNLKKWGERWITELDDLAAPLYSGADEETFVRIESYIDSFPEISLVRFYSPDGLIVFSVFSAAEAEAEY